MTYWYLASPYSKFPQGLDAAFRVVSENAALLVRHKIPVYSPIAHTHPIAIFGGMDPLDHSIWLPADEPFMQGAHGLIVLRMDTWEISYGIGEEIKAFREASKPIVYMDPGIVPQELSDGL